MKNVKIDKIDYKVIERAPRTKKIIKVEFSFTMDGKVFKSLTPKLNKESFKVVVPFTNIRFELTKFKTLHPIVQENAICKMIDDFTGISVDVGTYEDMFIDVSVEKGIRKNILYKRDLLCINWYCNTEMGVKEMYNDHDSSKTDFHLLLIEYYENNEMKKDFDFFS